MAERTCVECGGALPTQHGNRRYCSSRCRWLVYEARRGPRKRTAPIACPLHYSTCVVCDRLFVSRRKGVTICSKPCRNRRLKQQKRADGRLTAERQRYRERWPEKERSSKRRAQERFDRKRSAARRGASIRGAGFTLDDVIDRDGWRCALCGQDVDPALAWPHPMSKSLDHAVPVSLGGAHTLANSQLAHLGCNSAKGNRCQGYNLEAI